MPDPFVARFCFLVMRSQMPNLRSMHANCRISQPDAELISTQRIAAQDSALGTEILTHETAERVIVTRNDKVWDLLLC